MIWTGTWTTKLNVHVSIYLLCRCIKTSVVLLTRQLYVFVTLTTEEFTAFWRHVPARRAAAWRGRSRSCRRTCARWRRNFRCRSTGTRSASRPRIGFEHPATKQSIKFHLFNEPIDNCDIVVVYDHNGGLERSLKVKLTPELVFFVEYRHICDGILFLTKLIVDLDRYECNFKH